MGRSMFVSKNQLEACRLIARQTIHRSREDCEKEGSPKMTKRTHFAAVFE